MTLKQTLGVTPTSLCWCHHTQAARVLLSIFCMTVLVNRAITVWTWIVKGLGGIAGIMDDTLVYAIQEGGEDEVGALMLALVHSGLACIYIFNS